MNDMNPALLMDNGIGELSFEEIESVNGGFWNFSESALNVGPGFNLGFDFSGLRFDPALGRLVAA